MEISNEDLVTGILTKQEILKKSNIVNNQMNPISEYDLGEYLAHKKSEPSRFGSKYIFVK